MTVKSLLTPEQWAEARRLRAEGASLDALAEQFGVAHSTMGRRARKEGWSSPSGSPSTRAPTKPAVRIFAAHGTSPRAGANSGRAAAQLSSYS